MLQIDQSHNIYNEKFDEKNNKVINILMLLRNKYK